MSAGPQKCYRGRTDKRAGFTLIEMVVAMALMSLIGVAMVASLRFAQRSYAQINRAESAMSELAASQRVLRELLESAYPYAAESSSGSAPASLVGSKHEVSFSAAGLASSGSAGLQRFAVVLRRNQGQSASDVVLRWWTDRNGLAPPQEGTVAEEVLVAGVESVEWAYLMSGTDAQLGGGAGAQSLEIPDHSWLDEWRERDRLPAAVRVRIKYPSIDSRAPAGGWPELIVKPRITDDANCEFDVVGQDCRRVY